MKVLHAAETIKGGVATVMRQIALANVASAEVEDIHCLVPENQKSEINGLSPDNVITFKRTGRNIASFFSFLRVFIVSIRQYKPDIIHLHSTFAGVLGRIALMILYPIYRPKVIYCPHAFSFLMEGNKLKKSLYKNIERLLLPITDAVICVSEFERNAAIENGLKEEKLHVVYNGVPVVDTNKIFPNPYQEDVVNLLFVGRFDYQKGFDILSAMIEKLKGKPFHLTIVGGAVHGEDIYPDLPQTTYTGWLSSDKIAPYFSHADVLIVPSRWEGFAMVSLEAMSYGVPVVSSNCTSFPEMIFPGKNGYMFDLSSPASLTEIVENKSKEGWALMGINARTIFMEKFISERMIEGTLNIYKKSLN